MMKIRNRTSYLEALPEGRAPVNLRSRITRFLFLLVLFGLAAYILFLIIDRLMFVYGTGQVEIVKTRIAPLHGGRVAALNVVDGDRIDAGRTLALISPRSPCIKTENTRLIKLQSDISLKIARLKVYKDRYTAMPGEGDQALLRRALEINTAVYKKQKEIQKDRQKLRFSIDELETEIDLLQVQLQQMREEQEDRQLRPECHDETIVAPFAGRVKSVLRRTHEYIDRGDTLFILEANTAKIRIEAYFDAEDLEYIRPGKLVRVDFPDGERGIGEIDKIYSAAYDSSERKTDQYQPIPAMVRTDLQPWTKGEADRWKNYDRLELNLRVGK